MTEPIIEKTVEEAKRSQRVVNAYHRVFNTPEGKMVLEDLKKYFRTDLCMYLSVQPYPTKFDPIGAAVRDGHRAVILRMEGMLKRKMKGDANVRKPKSKVVKG